MAGIQTGPPRTALRAFRTASSAKNAKEPYWAVESLDPTPAPVPSADVVLGSGDFATHLCDHSEQRLFGFDGAPF
jgi:hypothetical protein